MTAQITSPEMLRHLVGFPTVSRMSNLDLIGFVEGYLAGLGVASHRVADETGQKANLFATIGPADTPGVCLSGHTDVVPVDGQAWSDDPFAMVGRDGRLYGRGTVDMKGFVATVLALVPEMLAAPLKTPIHLAFSYDEEVGCLGVRRLIAALPVRPAMCIVGEPTGMAPVIAHKGKRSYRVEVTGFACHSSQAPRGVNAVDYAAELVCHLRRLAARLRSDGPFDAGFDPPHSTVHTGTFAGGTALNIVPDRASLEWEIRHLPDHDPAPIVAEVERLAREVLEPEMRATAPDCAIRSTEIINYPGFAVPADAPVVALARNLSGANATAKVAYGTEAGLFQAAGIPTVVCGPGSIDQAHKPDEFIALDQIAACETFLRRLIRRLSD
ncbi:MAG: acetylornithine deacetylase [Rhodospirillaceae bacterium]|nr:acetylornithine deacetylase [Rhodospirillaceae bacterium]